MVMAGAIKKRTYESFFFYNSKNHVRTCRNLLTGVKYKGDLCRKIQESFKREIKGHIS